MSDKYMTVEEAARHLGASVKTVRRRIEEGFFTVNRIPGSPRHYLDPMEVEEHRKDVQSAAGGAVISRAEFVRMKAQVRRLTAQVAVLMQILDNQGAPLKMNAAYAKDLYETCRGHLKRTNWDLHEIEPWVEIFFRINEDDFFGMSTATGEPRPWVAFLKLCLAMTAHISTKPEYHTSLELQSLHKKLAESRRRLRVSALIYTETYRTVDADIRTSGFLDSSVEDTLRSSIGAKKKR